MLLQNSQMTNITFSSAFPQFRLAILKIYIAIYKSLRATTQLTCLYIQRNIYNTICDKIQVREGNFIKWQMSLLRNFERADLLEPKAWVIKLTLSEWNLRDLRGQNRPLNRVLIGRLSSTVPWTQMSVRNLSKYMSWALHMLLFALLTFPSLP
jgi:hypothetical protein